MRRYSKPWF